MQLKSGDFYATEFQGPGCFAAKDTFGWFTLSSKMRFSKELVVALIFFLETVVKIAMLGLIWKRNNSEKTGPGRSTVSLNSITVLKCVVCNNTGPPCNKLWFEPLEKVLIPPSIDFSLEWWMIKLKISCRSENHEVVFYFPQLSRCHFIPNKSRISAVYFYYF